VYAGYAQRAECEVKETAAMQLKLNLKMMSLKTGRVLHRVMQNQNSNWMHYFSNVLQDSA
jgi:hypothetical protein